MSLSRKVSLSSSIIAQCLVVGWAATAPPAEAATVPGYFFKTWTVSKNCTEQHAGLAARVQAGLRFRIVPRPAEDGSYVFEAQDGAQQHWAANWNGMKLEYRPGTKMTTVPADFECIPGQEASSPFLAMSGYAQASEPYYEQQHWYGLARIHGQLEHVLIFPRDVTGDAAAIIVMQSVNSPTSVKLDDDGVIHSSD